MLSSSIAYVCISQPFNGSRLSLLQSFESSFVFGQMKVVYYVVVRCLSVAEEAIQVVSGSQTEFKDLKIGL